MPEERKPGTPEQNIISPVDRNKRLQEYFSRPGLSQKVDFQSLKEVGELIKNFNDIIFRVEERRNGYRNALKSLSVAGRVNAFLTENALTFKVILLEKAQEALDSNPDLNYGPWRTHLLNRLRLEGLVEVYPILTQRENELIFGGFEVYILENLQERLGTIQDYADAVRATRDLLGYGNKPISGGLATKLWYERLWLPGRGHAPGNVIKSTSKFPKKNVKTTKKLTKKGTQFYKQIMRTRLEEMGLLAPYWELLDNGYIDYIGDRGGYAKPDFAPSWFVNKAEQAVKDYCNNHFNPDAVLTEEIETARNLEVSEKHLKELRTIRRLLINLYKELSYETVYSKNLALTITSLNLSFAEAIARSRESDVLKEITKNKIEIFANQIIAGDQLSKRLYFWTSGRAVNRARTFTARVRVNVALAKANLPPTTEGVVKIAKDRIEKLRAEIKILQAKNKNLP